MDTKDSISVLARQPPGMGGVEYGLEARTKEEKYSINIQVNERTYDEKELEEVFQKGKEWLDTVWLGENTSNEKVMSDLYFPTSIDHLDLKVRWESNHPEWIRSDGKIMEMAYEEAPQKLAVDTILNYGSYEKRYTYSLTIVPPQVSTEDDFEAVLTSRLQSADENSRTDEHLELPTEIDGHEVVWYRKKNRTWLQVFLFGSIILFLLYFTNEEKKIQKIKDRKEALSQDYPEIVYRLIVLIGAGMTVKNAWEKVIEVYKREKDETGKSRWGYEEMITAHREMTNGISEIKAYENFGKRCGSQNYMRLSELLAQQVRRGARGMNHLLMQEVTESEIAWRENSRKRAEKAGTKLLLPMVLLMTVVFAVLMIPAFLSMSV